MSLNDSVSQWLLRLKTGDEQAAENLWQRYFLRLVQLARTRLSSERAAEDEEDVALSAFTSFWRGAVAGRFPRLHDRDDLWRILLVIVSRKVYDHTAGERRLKRGGGVRTASFRLDQLIGDEPTPEFAALVAEQCQLLLNHLGDETLRTVAVLKMEGHTSDEIAQRLEVVPRTVERKLRLIRQLWEDMSPPEA